MCAVVGVVGLGPAVAKRPVADWSFPDPAAAPYRGGLLAVATGNLAPRAVAATASGPWKRTGHALVRRPGWASSSGIWAADVVHVKHHWLLYFSASVRGLGPDGRCIGVAVSRSALGRFVPVGRPLVCPRGASTAPAPDPARPARGRLPHRGVIDPSVLGVGRRLYLVYKTQGLPSTIRILPLHHRGVFAGRHSVEVLRAHHIVENPVILRRGHGFVMLTSEGSYGSCSYATVWRRSRHLFRWAGARPRVLLTRADTGVCGPGGADVVRRKRGQLVVFHGWTCGTHARVCPSGRRMDLSRGLDARRSLYAVRLVWRAGLPHLRPLPAKHHQRPRHHRTHRHPAHRHPAHRRLALRGPIGR